jgi:hypothetical protein
MLGGEFTKTGNVIEGGFSNSDSPFLIVCFKGKAEGNKINLLYAVKKDSSPEGAMDEYPSLDLSDARITPIKPGEIMFSYLKQCGNWEWTPLLNELNAFEEDAQKIVSDFPGEAGAAGVAAAGAREGIGIAQIREAYINQIRKAANEILEEAWSGKISAQEGAEKAVKLRNYILEVAREEGPAFARAIAAKKKEVGKSLAALQEQWANYAFKKPYSQLSNPEKDIVALKIIGGAGRPNQDYIKLAKYFGMAGKTLAVVTVAISAYKIFVSDNKLLTAGREGTIIGGGIVGGGIALAIFGCAATAIICVGAALFVGSFIGAEAAEKGFDFVSEWLRKDN